MVIEFKKPGVTSETVTLMRDGNQIVALLGPDLQAGIGGFGDTAVEALRDLAGPMEFEITVCPVSISDPTAGHVPPLKAHAPPRAGATQRRRR